MNSRDSRERCSRLPCRLCCRATQYLPIQEFAHNVDVLLQFLNLPYLTLIAIHHHTTLSKLASEKEMEPKKKIVRPDILLW